MLECGGEASYVVHTVNWPSAWPKAVVAGRNVQLSVLLAMGGCAAAIGVQLFCYSYICQGMQGTDRKNVRASRGDIPRHHRYGRPL